VGSVVENRRPARPEVSLYLVAHMVYGLFALGVLSAGMLGIASLAGVVLAYVKRADATGTIYAAHLDWVLSTFWWSLLWLALSAVASLVFVGWITGVVALIWLVYRIIKGWLALWERQPPLG